ncbi:hypothetical protein ASPBRDRAFT_610207 [Aspergillus brasiliensis CBS 101740]|uniref:Uncharacterized protein n=1 Tax=Aspergillus brasiliensis (strain CBS 101740 / IMI 381727 / IBT 21946) TaxID=767769 RepID=A0A1L9UIB7_ASPBC|nr:hypothetical protein ASPBRDRAFT_610207 [Aspergillus brasiliensis CBS 101740]
MELVSFDCHFLRYLSMLLLLFVAGIFLFIMPPFPLEKLRPRLCGFWLCIALAFSGQAV